MAKYDVKYNPSKTPITGATQIGNLAVATGDVDYTTGGWIPGLDNVSGYVIYSDTTSTNLTGRTTAGGKGIAGADKPTFWKTPTKTNSALLHLINRLPGSPGTFSNVDDAKTWLNSSPNYGTIISNFNSGDAIFFNYVMNSGNFGFSVMNYTTDTLISDVDFGLSSSDWNYQYYETIDGRYTMYAFTNNSDSNIYKMVFVGPDGVIQYSDTYNSNVASWTYYNYKKGITFVVDDLSGGYDYITYTGLSEKTTFNVPNSQTYWFGGSYDYYSRSGNAALFRVYQSGHHDTYLIDTNTGAVTLIYTSDRHGSYVVGYRSNVIAFFNYDTTYSYLDYIDVYSTSGTSIRRINVYADLGSTSDYQYGSHNFDFYGNNKFYYKLYSPYTGSQNTYVVYDGDADTFDYHTYDSSIFNNQYTFADYIDPTDPDYPVSTENLFILLTDYSANWTALMKYPGHNFTTVTLSNSGSNNYYEWNNRITKDGIYLSVRTNDGSGDVYSIKYLSRTSNIDFALTDFSSFQYLSGGDDKYYAVYVNNSGGTTALTFNSSGTKLDEQFMNGSPNSIGYSLGDVFMFTDGDGNDWYSNKLTGSFSTFDNVTYGSTETQQGSDFDYTDNTTIIYNSGSPYYRLVNKNSMSSKFEVSSDSMDSSYFIIGLDRIMGIYSNTSGTYSGSWSVKLLDFSGNTLDTINGFSHYDSYQFYNDRLVAIFHDNSNNYTYVLGSGNNFKTFTTGSGLGSINYQINDITW